MLLQANDFKVLYEREGCELQVAGSDQWGNITAGIELIRRSIGGTAHGLTSPLLLRADGTKFGKSESGAVWLDPALTSPYQFFQFFMQVGDDEVGTLLRRFTLVPVPEIDDVVADHLREPQRRRGQRRLAAEVTALVHGPEVVPAIEAATDVLFGGDPTAATAQAFELLASEVPTVGLGSAELEDGIDPLDLFVRAGLAKSKGEVRRNLAGHYVNGSSIEGVDRVASSDLLHHRFVLLRRGKAHHALGNRHTGLTPQNDLCSVSLRPSDRVAGRNGWNQRRRDGEFRRSQDHPSGGRALLDNGREDAQLRVRATDVVSFLHLGRPINSISISNSG